MQTAGGAVFKTNLFTLPRIWKQLQVSNWKIATTFAAPCLQLSKADRCIGQAGLHRISRQPPGQVFHPAFVLNVTGHLFLALLLLSA